MRVWFARRRLARFVIAESGFGGGEVGMGFASEEVVVVKEREDEENAL